MLFLDIATFLHNNYKIIILIVLLLVISMGVAFIIFFKNQKEKSFDKRLSKVKSEKISICIDLSDNKVEKYYLYDKEGKYEILPLDAFFMQFDKNNVVKLKEWLNHIGRVTDFNKTRRIEVVMYQNKTNKRRVYLVELDCYIAELSKYYLTFKDITASMGLRQKITKVEILNDDEIFFKNANAKNYSSDSDSLSYLCAFRFREYAFALKELQHEIMLSLEEKIYFAIEKEKLPEEIICSIDDGTIVLFTTGVNNEKRYVSHIKSVIQNVSREYELIKHQFKYTVNIVAGYIDVKKEDVVTMDTIMKAKSAANYLISNASRSNKLRFFDENMKTYYDETNKKMLAVEDVINNDLFEIEYIPVMEIKDKKVKGFYVKVNISSGLDMDYATFINFAKQKHLRDAFYKKIFDNIRAQKDKRRSQFYLSFDFDDIHRVFGAYNSKDEYQNINCYFCIEFSNVTLQNYNLIEIEKTLASYQNDKIKYGISYTTATPLYLNAKIYSKISVVLFSGLLIDGLLANYNYGSLLSVYIDVAKSYGHDIIGLNIDSIALYETLVHAKVNKLGGKFITSHISNGIIEDETILKTLIDIEKRPY